MVECFSAEVSNRTYSVSVTDSNTIELGIAISGVTIQIACRPAIINNLKRTNLMPIETELKALEIFILKSI